MTKYLILLTCFILPVSALAHPYFPLREGIKTTLNYSFFVNTTRKEFKQADTKGSLASEIGTEEEKDGKKYFRFTTTYKDIPYSKEPVIHWKREEAGVLYAASIINGKISETVELPADLSLGTEWDYFDGEKSKRKVTSVLALEFEGKKFPDCIEVTRVITKKTLSNVTNISYYCLNVGEVKSIFKQPTPVGDYITETFYASHE